MSLAWIAGMSAVVKGEVKDQELYNIMKSLKFKVKHTKGNRVIKAVKRDSIATMDPYHLIPERDNRSYYLEWKVESE